MLEIRKKEGESVGSFLFRFSKRVKQSGILKEVKKRRFHGRVQNRRKVRLAALYRQKKREELARLKKYGFGSSKEA